MVCAFSTDIGETTDHALVSIRLKHWAFSFSWSRKAELLVMFPLQHVTSVINLIFLDQFDAGYEVSICFKIHETKECFLMNLKI